MEALAARRTPSTRYDVSIFHSRESGTPGSPLGQSGRAPRGRGDAGIKPHFGECLTPTSTTVAETRGSAAIRTPLTRRVSARPAPGKRDGCEAPRRAGVPAPSPAPILGGWRADDGRASSLVRGNTARAGEARFSRRPPDGEDRHSVNSVVRRSAAPLLEPPERRGFAAASGKTEKTASLYRGRGDMTERADGALRDQGRRALQATQFGAVFARARDPPERGHSARNLPRADLRVPPRRRIWTIPRRPIPRCAPSFRAGGIFHTPPRGPHRRGGRSQLMVAVGVAPRSQL